MQISIIGAIITKHLRYAMVVTCGAAQFDPNLTTPKMGVRIISMTCAWACGQPGVVGSALSKKTRGKMYVLIVLLAFKLLIWSSYKCPFSECIMGNVQT